MPEVGLGIGRHQGIVAGIPQELLSWYDSNSNRYLTAEEIAQLQLARAEQLAQYLRRRVSEAVAGTPASAACR